MKRKTTNNTIWASGRQLAFLVPLFLLGACTMQDDVTDTPQAGRATLAVNEVTTLTGGTSTRAASAPPAGSSIGVFRQADSYYTTASNNVKYTLGSGGKWAVATVGTDILLGANDSRALLYAYYPNNGKIAVEADNVTVALAARAYDADYDLAYMAAGNAVATDAGGLVYNFHPGVNFTMKRAYTQLAVSLTRGGDYGGVGAVTAVSLKLNGGGKLYSTGTQNIATGDSLPGTADIDKITYTVPANTKVTTAAKTATFAQLLPPGKSGTISNLTLTVTVDGVTTNTTIAAADLAMEAGKRYLVKATLNYYGLAASVKTTDWDSQTAWNDEATFVPVIPPVDLGLPFVIASGNLLAASDGLGGYTYSFAEDQGYYSGDGSDGDYYCWNTLDPNLTNEVQPTWDDARDACRQVDDGNWYTPSMDQWKLMLDKGSVWGTYAAGSGTKNGYYIGTTSIPSEANRNKFLFLPATGGRYGEGSWSGMNTMAYYWSSTFSNSYSAHSLFFTKDVIAEEGGTDRYYAFPLRCIKDKPKSTPEYAIDLGLDFYIANGNVVATSDGGGGYIYTFAKEQGYNSESDSYFCWNTLEPGQTNTSQLSWDDARDVCRKIGDGSWRTPTTDQLTRLINAGWYGDDNVYLMNDKTLSSGGFFGTSTRPQVSEQDNFVFLPTAGKWNPGDSKPLTTTRDGYYWTNDDSNNTNSTFLSFDLWGYNGLKNVTKTCAASVRCVKDK